MVSPLGHKFMMFFKENLSSWKPLSELKAQWVIGD